MTRHIVEAFEAELERLRKCIVQMGEQAASQLSDAMTAVRQCDDKLASNTIERDLELDALDRQISEDAVTLLALRQPMAADLRAIVAAIKIPADLEKIGDLAKGIAKRAYVGRTLPRFDGLPSLPMMADLVIDQIKRVMEAYITQDAETAIDVWRRDSKIDDWHSAVFRELLTYMMEDPRKISTCAHLMFIAKNLERAGDLCTHIADSTYFAVTGERLDAARPKGEDISQVGITPDA